MKSFGQIGQLEHTLATINVEAENQSPQMMSFKLPLSSQVTLETPSGVHEFECPPDVP